MIHPDARFRTDPDVAYTRFDEAEGVLLHLTTKHFFSLNETAVVIWEGIARQQPVAQIARTLAETYDISPEAALQHVGRFVDDAQRNRLITACDDA